MGHLVGAIAVSHAPGLTGWFDKATETQQRNLRRGFNELAESVAVLKPDVIVGLANDHLMSMPFSCIPDFCVGTAGMWSGPTAWYRDRLGVPDFTVPGHTALARTIVRHAARAGMRLAFTDELEFTDNWSIPLRLLTPDYDIPFVPIHMNCIVHPLPSPKRCFELGRIIADIVHHGWPGPERVLVMATGGLSHDPGGPKYFQIDEEFDRWFLEVMCAGDPDRILREVTVERMLAAGEGGTTELLAWIAALGAAGDRPARTLFYEPTLAFRCGSGAIAWDMSAMETPA